MESNEKVLWLVDNIRDQLVLGRSLIEIEKRLRPVATDGEIESAMQIVKSEASAKRVKQRNIIIDKTEPEDWYTGPNYDQDSH